MGRVTTDTSDLRKLSTDLRAAPSSIAPKVNAVVAKGANNIKRSMIEQLRASNYKHFRAAANAVDYDWIDGADFVGVEIGPKVGPGEQGGAAGIAYGTMYYGGSKGGGSVRDPIVDLEEEQPKFEAALGDLLEDLL
jgi:hypothetical protein